VMVVDSGLFFSLALRLSQHFGRVLFFSEWDSACPSLGEVAVGDGFGEVERVKDFWGIDAETKKRLIDAVDLFIFPNLGNEGIQDYLQALGKNVWGNRNGGRLEQNREYLLRLQSELKMDVPGYKVVVGMENLRAHLKTVEDKWIKISFYRNDCETFHHQSYEQSRAELDALALKWGDLQDMIRFVVCDTIKTDIETGGDFICIDGKFADHAVLGFEKKNRCYLATIKPYGEISERVTGINAKLAPTLREYGYRNFISSEVRIYKDKDYLIDITNRAGFPSGYSQFNLYANLPEIFWNGAQGKLVPVRPAAKFCVEAIIAHKGDKTHWRNIRLPDEVMLNVNLICPVKLDDNLYTIPPLSDSTHIIGSVCGTGNTVEEAMKAVDAVVEKIKDNEISVDTEALYDLIKEAEESRKHGIDFAKKLPKPEAVLT
jgi:hypothetical protein